MYASVLEIPSLFFVKTLEVHSVRPSERGLSLDECACCLSAVANFKLYTLANHPRRLTISSLNFNK